jgi:hypothetical protein
MTYKPVYDEETNLEVRRTNDYNKFKFIHFNRPVSPKHVFTLKEQIRRKDMQTIITVDNNYGILDGQHRFTAYKELGMPFYYVKLPISSIEETANYFMAVNSNNKGLSNADYVRSLAKVYMTGTENLPAKYELGYKIYSFYYKHVENNTDLSMSYQMFIGFIDYSGLINNIRRRNTSVDENMEEIYNDMVQLYNQMLPILVEMKKRRQLTVQSAKALARFNNHYANQDSTIIDNLLQAYMKYGAYDEFFRKMPTSTHRIFDRLIDCYNFHRPKKHRIESP